MSSCFFPRPSEGGATLVVELDDNLFEAVDGVEFDIVAYNLVQAGGYVSVVDMHIRSRRRPTSKSAQVSELAIGRLLLPPRPRAREGKRGQSGVGWRGE